MELNPYAVGRSALVVDDTQMMRAVVKSCLKSLGFKTIIEAIHGGEALKLVESQKVDLIICDWEMPNMNGLELLRYLREQQNYQNIPFIMLTANANAELVSESVTLGVDGFVIKPFQPQALCDKIITMLKNQSERAS